MFVENSRRKQRFNGLFSCFISTIILVYSFYQILGDDFVRFSSVLK